MKTIDLRSDTVTKPTQQMRQAMAQAEVGDDGWGEDPTVNRLQELAAEKMGKEAALFVPSGTMGNLVAALTHCGRGAEMIVGSESHILYYEVGGTSALGGIPLRTIDNDRLGRLDPKAVEAAIRPPYIGFPTTGLISLENTHNRCGGTTPSLDYMRSISQIAAQHEVPIHLDGARIFNAATHLGVTAKDLAKEATSVLFCLSKGLSAPVGSLLCGPSDFIDAARKNRRMVGGAMRQAGVIAAAGIVALETMIDRLAEDHANAKTLAEGLAALPSIALDPDIVHTNIVAYKLEGGDAADFASRLEEKGVRISTLSERRLRMVTHFGIEQSDVLDALKAVGETLQEMGLAGARVPTP
jgi:threonine aldolase